MQYPTAGRILLCRHGQTEFNAGARYQGQIDTELSDLGREQALQLGLRLMSEHIDCAYSSDLKRAADTARLALGERPVELHLDVRLRELSFGRWEGQTFVDVQQRFPEDIAARDRDRVHFAPRGGGESLTDLGKRITDFLTEVLPTVEGRTVLLVAHGGSINALISTIIGIPLTAWWRLRNNNANLSRIDFTPGGPRLSTFNETCHLAGGWK